MIDSTQWQRYVDNQCTPEEKKEIALWLSQVSSDELDTLVEAGWDRDAPPIPGEVDFRVRTALEKRMSARPRRLNARVHRMTAAPRRLDKRIWLAAASVVLLVWPRGSTNSAPPDCTIVLTVMPPEDTN